MEDCNLCGRKVHKLLNCRIEDSVLMVCRDCAESGAIIRKPRAMSQSRRNEIVSAESIVSDYASKIKRARESRNLSIELLASKLKEKESILHRIEQGKFNPPIGLAKKIERVLRISLMSASVEANDDFENKKISGALTLGDLLSEKLKNKKIFKD